MAKKEKPSGTQTVQRLRPATTPTARENQLIALAMRAAEQQMLDGTASAQVITHFLKLGSTRERLEKEKLEKENDLLTAKRDAIKSSERYEELYTKAIAAMKSYSGSPVEEDETDEDDY